MKCESCEKEKATVETLWNEFVCYDCYKKLEEAKG